MHPALFNLVFADIGDNVVVIVAVFMLFGGGGLLRHMMSTLSRTRIELAQLRSQNTSNTGSREITELREEVAQLRAQMTDLRDTTTQYDISFDTALRRVEQRVQRVEQQQQVHI